MCIYIYIYTYHIYIYIYEYLSLSIYIYIYIYKGSLAFALLAERGEPPEAAALQVTFIGLASLTAPHMLLVDGIFRSRLHSIVWYGIV